MCSCFAFSLLALVELVLVFMLSLLFCFAIIDKSERQPTLSMPSVTIVNIHFQTAHPKSFTCNVYN